MFNMIGFRWVLVGLVAVALVSGCAKKPAPSGIGINGGAPVITAMPSEEIVDSGIGEEAVVEAEVVPEVVVAAPVLRRIHFDFDQYVLSAAAREILAENAAYLAAYPGVKLLIEGHCDERGSDEYNLALGERRALSAKNYLVSLGVAPARLSVISYGEEMPLDSRNNEMAWVQNRRAEFKEMR